MYTIYVLKNTNIAIPVKSAQPSVASIHFIVRYTFRPHLLMWARGTQNAYRRTTATKKTWRPYICALDILMQNMYQHTTTPRTYNSPAARHTSNKICSLNLNLVYDDFDGRRFARASIYIYERAMIGARGIGRDGKPSSGGNKSENVNFRNLLWLFRCIFRECVRAMCPAVKYTIYIYRIRTSHFEFVHFTWWTLNVCAKIHSTSEPE